MAKEALKTLVGSLMEDFSVFGPSDEDGHTLFRRLKSEAELSLDYRSTMLPPSKVLFYKPVEEILRFDIGKETSVHEIAPEDVKALAVGVHPCDVHAVLYLDRVFREDPYYMRRRENTILVALNCTGVDGFCFCSSVGTGPHLEAEGGCDLLLTDLGDFYLAEPKSPRAERLVAGATEAGEDDILSKDEQKRGLVARMTKHIDVRGLDSLFLENLEHPVWSEVADSRCLSCSNCVMVCPTCFCYDVVDETDMGLKTVMRHRRWDSCQDIRFAEVHGGNFRRTRAARLRQFVTHKLDYTPQFGAPGTVGCGRCIRWCPTGIDLTEMAKDIQRSPVL